MTKRETNLRSRVDALWDDLTANYRSTMTDTDLKALRSLDDGAIDGTLTEAQFDKAKTKLMQGRRRSWSVTNTKVDPEFRKHLSAREGAIFGDFELIIDTSLGGDPDVKEAVAAADADGRRGLASLKYHLKKAGVKVHPAAAHAMRSCELDQESYEAGRKALDTSRNIEIRRGKYRVSRMLHGERDRATFDTLEEAIAYRDCTSD